MQNDVAHCRLKVFVHLRSQNTLNRLLPNGECQLGTRKIRIRNTVLTPLFINTAMQHTIKAVIAIQERDGNGELRHIRPETEQ